MEAAARAGFRAVEMHFPYDVDAAAVAALARDTGLTLLGINTHPGQLERGDRGLGAVPGREAEFAAAVEQSIQYCVACGARAIHAMAGNVSPDDRPRARQVFKANLESAARKAAAANLTVLLEPLNPRDAPGYLLRTQEQGAAIVAAIGRDRIGLQFDLYHCQTAQGDLTTRLAALMPVIGHMQLADVPGRHEPGTGEIGWEFVFRRIDELGYAGWIGCEYAPLDDTVEGLAWRRRYGV